MSNSEDQNIQDVRQNRLSFSGSGGGGGGAVTSVFGRTGAVVAQTGDYTVAQVTGAAPLASPALTGNPTAPTQAPLDNSTKLATTAYADAAVAVEKTRALAAEALLAPLASPALTGVPTAPTAAPATSTTQLATTAFVQAATAAGVTSFNGRTGAVVPQTGDYTVAQVTGAAPLASPALTGNPTAPTQAPLDNSTKLATTAYADAAVAVEKTRALAAEALLAPLASPALTGNPTAPTQAPLDNSTKLATTAYTDAAVAVEAAARAAADALLLPKANPIFTGNMKGPRYYSNGSALVMGDISLGAGWGTGPTIGVEGTDEAGIITIACGTTPALNPTVTLTFHDGAWATTPIVVVTRTDAAGSSTISAANNTMWAVTARSTTAITFTLRSIPTNGNVYSLAFICMGK